MYSWFTNPKNFALQRAEDEKQMAIQKVMLEQEQLILNQMKDQMKDKMPLSAGHQFYYTYIKSKDLQETEAKAKAEAEVKPEPEVDNSILAIEEDFERQI